MIWDPQQYLTFSAYRDRPFFDLTARIGAQRPRRIIDLGCGPGSLTATLAVRWPDADVVGLDSSPEMIRAAGSMADSPVNLRFELADVGSWQPGAGDDVVVSNAALQWVPGHVELLRTWLERLAPGAWLAFQVPSNFGSPSHQLMRETAASQKFEAELRGVLRHDDAVAEPADYLGLFRNAAFDAEAWETTYSQLLSGPDPVLEWVRGTGLRPVLQALTPERAADFERVYARKLREAYPATKHGTVFPFRRTFAVGRKPVF